MDNIYKKIGKRIKELREKAGLSQKEVAIKIGIKRPTISQIENGERKISAEEILEISNLFNVTPNNMLELEEELEVVLEKKKDIGVAKPKERINVPQKNLKKFKEVLLYILNKVGSKSNVGETVIYKLLYFIDFNFYEKSEKI